MTNRQLSHTLAPQKLPASPRSQLRWNVALFEGHIFWHKCILRKNPPLGETGCLHDDMLLSFLRGSHCITCRTSYFYTSFPDSVSDPRPLLQCEVYTSLLLLSLKKIHCLIFRVESSCRSANLRGNEML